MQVAEYPWGLPPERLSSEDREKVRIGNSCVRATLQVVKWCDAHRLPWVIENPHTSKLWQLPEIQHLLCSPHTEASIIDFCGYGRPWRKRTQLLSGNVCSQDLERLRHRRCGGAPVCRFTGQRQFHLTGTGPRNVPWTQLAQPYPPGLCLDLAAILSSDYMFAGQHPQLSSWMIWG